MTKIKAILIIFLIVACNSEDANDCFQTSGRLITEEREVTPFSRILVNENVNLIIREGDDFNVSVETGANLINEVEVEVIGDQLVLSDTNDCNFVRDFGITVIIVTAPDITEIRSSTQFDVRSEGVLTFENLRIISEDFGNDEFLNTGNFFLNIENESVTVIFNNLSNCFIEGSTNNLNVSFFAGNSRFEGSNFIVTDIELFHRGTNDMLLFPTNSIRGDIFATGDVQIFNRPPVIEVIEHFNGRLIFRD